MGAESMDVPGEDVTVGGLFDVLEGNGRGFTRFNTLLVVNDDEAISASAQQDRELKDGDSVLLVPFSHGG